MSNLSSAKSAITLRKALSKTYAHPKKKVSLIIRIEGKSAENLLPVGPKDIRDHFLEHGFGKGSFNPKDVKSIKFVVPATTTYSRRINKPVHKENF
jgi:hypothetical protein